MKVRQPNLIFYLINFKLLMKKLELPSCFFLHVYISGIFKLKNKRQNPV